jgi:hypothetical protein
MYTPYSHPNAHAHTVYKKEKAARDACEARIRKMEMEIEPRNEQERVYRENQEQLRRKLVESRDRLILMLQEAQRMREVRPYLHTYTQRESICLLCVCQDGYPTRYCIS